MAETVRRRLVVQGHVQGVFFRDSLRQRAQDAGVAGWAKNREDGAVEVVLEGSPDAVQEVVSFCQTGPPRADVEDLEVSDEEPEGLTRFTTK